MARFISENFLPIRVHVREQAAEFKRFADRYSAQWTPTILILDPDGQEQHRIEGFLPANDLLSQLALGLGHAAFKRGDWPEAARRFESLAKDGADGDSAAEATYWAGVSRYKASGDAGELGKVAETFAHHHQGTPWAKKASVWARPG